MTAAPLLKITDLSVAFGGGKIAAARRLSFEIAPGEVVALVGESGSGKSTIALALMGLLDPRATQVSGSAEIERKTGARADLLALPERELRRLRGDDLAMIFQEPMTSLDPIYRIGRQIGEAIDAHQQVSGAARDAESLRLLDILGVPSPDRVMNRYPHELSGGMRQRVMIAMALSCKPRLLIADEPTTALDVTIQAQIIDQLSLLQRQTGMAILFITHDLGLVSEIADRVLVMYAGRIVESGPVAEVFAAPRMPYTAGLMRSRPKPGGKRAGAGRIQAIPGGPPNAMNMPQGCAFHPRCAHAQPGRCDAAPIRLETDGDRAIRCLRWREITP